MVFYDYFVESPPTRVNILTMQVHLKKTTEGWPEKWLEKWPENRPEILDAISNDESITIAKLEV